MTVDPPHEEEIADDVAPDFVDELIERDKIRLPGRHLHHFAVLDDRHELMDEHFHLRRFVPQPLQRCQDVGIRGDMIRAQDVDHKIEPPAKLFAVIGDIG